MEEEHQVLYKLRARGLKVEGDHASDKLRAARCLDLISSVQVEMTGLYCLQFHGCTTSTECPFFHLAFSKAFCFRMTAIY